MFPPWSPHICPVGTPGLLKEVGEDSDHHRSSSERELHVNPAQLMMLARTARICEISQRFMTQPIRLRWRLPVLVVALASTLIGIALIQRGFYRAGMTALSVGGAFFAMLPV